MWNKLQSTPPFFILYVKQNKHHILITDYIRIWEIYLSEKELLRCLTESNRTLEMGEKELIQEGVQLLTNPQDLQKVNIIHDGSCIILSMTLFYEFSLKLKLTLQEGSKELKVIQPALKTIYDLKSSENELRKLLKKKDEEIDEYKSQAALPKYNDETHMKKHSVYSTNFGAQEIPCCVLEKEIHIYKENDNSEEPKVTVPIKTEPQSQEMTTNPPSINKLIQIKQEYMKNELPKSKKRRQINL